MGKNSIKQKLEDEITNVKDDVIKWRRYFHANPELSFQEIETSQYIRKILRSFGGYEIIKPTQTSVVATLKGTCPGPIIAFRADIDALPIHEEANVSFKSKKASIMHACGHDTHIAMALGAAKVLAKFKQDLKGEVRFIFQHAEEIPPGGAKEIMGTGVLDDVDMIVGLHIFPMFKSGVLGTKEGVLTSASDSFNITIKGKGGHASMPHEACDPVVIGAEITQALQTIVARRIDPNISQVVSVTQFNTGDNATNIIPNTIKLGGSIRSTVPSIRSNIRFLIRNIVEGISKAHGATYELNFNMGHDPVINNPEVTQLIKDIIKNDLPESTFVEIPMPLTVSEDFSAYTNKLPGTFIGLGAKDEASNAVYMNHHPKFTVDEDAFQIGVKLFVMIAARKNFRLN